MADDPGREQVGSVAEEAARLLDALGGWAESAGAAAGWAAKGPAAEAAARSGEAGEHGEPGEHSEPGEPADAAARCEHCGAESGVGRAVACQLCPVCQGIALLRSVRPETVDRLADLAAALSATLRGIAADRAGAAARRPGAEAGVRVQDIPVEDAAGDTGKPTRGARPT